MSAPAREARLGGCRRFMPRKPLARRIAPFPQQTGYGRELRAKELTKDGGIARGHRLRRCIFKGLLGQRDAVGMALTTAVAAGTAERSRRRRRGRSGADAAGVGGAEKSEMRGGAKPPSLTEKRRSPARVSLARELRAPQPEGPAEYRFILEGTQSQAKQVPILDTVPARHPWHAAPTRTRLGHRESARRAA